MKAVAKQERRGAYPLVLIFTLIAAGILATGYFYYRNYEQHFRTEAEHQLSAIAELKVNELTQYRKERLWDAGAFFKNVAFSGLVRRFLEHPEDAEAQQQIQDWAAKYLATGQYDLVCLFDAQGVVRLSVPAESPISSFVSRSVPEVLRSGQVTFQDFHRNEQDRQVYLTLLAPILDESDTNRPLGILAMRIDPETYLYPFIKRWPTPSRTGETLLVRRDGNDALFLNELKFRTNTVLNLRVSLENTNAPAVKAVLRETGPVEGADYRGVPTMAALQAIPDSPWFLVAKMDTAEVYAPLRERLKLTVLLVSFLLLSTGAGLSSIWRHQRLQFYQERYEIAETLRQSEERFRRVFEESPTGMAMLDETFHFIRVNPAFTSMLGYSEKELQKMAFTDVTHPDHVRKDVEQVRRLLRGEFAVYQTEKRYITRSGKELWGQVRVTVVRNADGAFRHFLAIISDITGRKRAEEELRRANRALRTVSECNQAMVRARDEALLLSDICRLLVEHGGYLMAWVGMAEQNEAKSVRPVAKAGNDAGYLDTLNITWADTERGRGPTGTAIRTGQPVIVRSILTDPAFEPWREAAIQRGYVAVTALPLMRDDRVFGALTVYVGEPDTFDANEMNLLTELAGDVAYGIVSLRARTERERAEEELRNSRALYFSLVENMPQSVFRKDRAGRFQFVNERFCRDLRRSPADIIGRTDADFFPAELAQAYRKDDLQVMETGRVLDREEKHAGADGRELVVHVLKTPLRDAQGQIIGIQGVFWDVTERKRAEEALHHEQTLTATLMENVPDAVYFKDAASRFLRVNRAHSRKFGLSDPAQLIGKTDADFFSGEHARKAQADEREIIRTGRPLLNVEEKETWLDGTVTWVVTTKLPLRDAAGRIIGTCGISRDITGRKQAEETIAHERQLLRTLIDLLPETFYIKDLDSRFLVVNEALAKQWGKENSSQLLGLSDADLFPAEVAAQYRDEDRKVFAGEPLMGREGTCVFADGRQHAVLTTKVPYRDSQGRICGLVGFGFDITDRKQTEVALQESEARYQRITEAITDYIYTVRIVDGRTVETKHGPGCLAVTGYRMEEFAADPFLWFRMVAAEDRPLVEEQARRILAGEDSPPIEHRIVHKNGMVRWVRNTFVPHRDEHGVLVIYDGLIQDITERKQAEEALRDSEGRYRQLFDLESNAIVLIDRETHRYMDVNQAAQQLYGYSQEEFLQMTPEDVSAEPEKTRNHIDTGDVHVPLRWHRKKNGERFAVEINANQIVHRGRRMALVALRDITERMRAEEALRESEARFRRLSDAAFEAVTIHKRGVLLSANDQYFKMFGYTPDELLGKEVLSLTVAPEALEYMMKQVDGGGLGPYESIGVRKDGTRFPMEIRVREGEYEGQKIRVGAIRDITERKQTEIALRESEERYRTIIEQAGDAIIIHDKTGRILDVNRKACQSLDYSREELLAKSIRDIDPEAIRAGKHELWGKILAGERATFESQQVCKDGSFLPVEVTLGSVCLSSGPVILGIVRDITERKRAEEALRASEERMRITLETTKIGSWDWDVKKDVWCASPTYFTMLGYEPSDHMDREKWLQRVHPDDLAATVVKIQEVLAGASSGYQYEHRIKHADGSYRWHSVIGHTIASDENGKPVRLIGVRLDITERKQAEVALRESQAELLSILESTGDGILAVDRGGERVIKANRRYAEMWRIPQSIIDAGDNAALRNFVLNQLSDPGAFLKRVHELYNTDTVAKDTLVFKDGRVFERHGFPMMLAGEVLGRVWSFRDVTERRRQERELNEKNLELERFTYTVSHDLKSPLVTVKTFLGYLEQDMLTPDTERVKQDVTYMRSAADKMGLLLDELLHLARVGRKTNPPVRATFQELAQEAVGLVAGRISTSGAEVQVADAAVVLEGDRPRLVEIWQNLVENACKFMGDQPKPRVEIGVEKRGVETVFFVRDNGSGIDPRYQEKVFSLFEKLNPKIEGAGMGLALIKRVVELYKGRIWVESGGVGQGANFLFTLPAAVILETGQSS